LSARNPYIRLSPLPFATAVTVRHVRPVTGGARFVLSF
jgi:hypothetical protein